MPAEWIAAHGLRPVRLLASAPREGSRPASWMGACAYAQSFLEEAGVAPGVAVIVTTRCDQMRRTADYLSAFGDKPVFLLNVPATWQSAAARQLHRLELERLGRFLVQLGGREPSNAELAAELRRSAAQREALLAARPRLSGRQFAEAITRFHGGASVVEPSPAPAPAPARAAAAIPLVLVGGPLMAQHWGLFDVLEASGARVVLDATLSGERALPPAFPTPGLEADPMTTLVNAYFDSIRDVFQRPNTPFYQWLGQQVAARQPRGVVLWRYAWCDLWSAETQTLKERLELPVLDLEAGDGAPLNHALVGRVQAFLEMIAP